MDIVVGLALIGKSACLGRHDTKQGRPKGMLKLRNRLYRELEEGSIRQVSQLRKFCD